MKLTQKQKKSLIRELDAFSTPGRSVPAPKKRKNKPSQRPGRQRGLGAGQSPSGARAVVGPGQRGISNTLGQNTQIPLEQTFAGSESLGRFNGSANFTETQFPINPGQAVTFPWLSQEAKLWEKYEFDSLRFEFRTTINEFSANALGRVILGVDFDAADPPPSTRSQAEISRPVTAQAPYFNQMLTLRKQDMCDTMKRHYVRPGALPGGSDIKMYDIGNLNFGTDGNVNANEVGELWVHYTGKFFVQVLEATTVAPNNNQVALFQGVNEPMTTAVAHTMALATTAANGLGAVNTGGSVLLPEGNYLLDVSAFVASTGAMTTGILAIEVSGAPVGIAPQFSFAAGAAAEDVPMSDTWYFQSTGANPVSVVMTVVGAGTITGNAQLRIVAV
jgi:hypothetical protein